MAGGGGLYYIRMDDNEFVIEDCEYYYVLHAGNLSIMNSRDIFMYMYCIYNIHLIIARACI